MAGGHISVQAEPVGSLFVLVAAVSRKAQRFDRLGVTRVIGGGGNPHHWLQHRLNRAPK